MFRHRRLPATLFRGLPGGCCSPGSSPGSARADSGSVTLCELPIEKRSYSEMLVEWKPRQNGYNFGDHIPSLYARIFTPEAWTRITEDKAVDYHLIGSVLDNTYLKRSRSAGRIPLFFGCGYRGKPLDGNLLHASRIIGVRGPLSQRAVSEAGSAAYVVGDSALLTPLLVRQRRSTGLKLLAPHINDPDRERFDPRDHGCDKLLSPTVLDQSATVERIKLISSASFVLAGAMHAAIVAYTYGVPFAFFDAGHRDCPMKWVDWAMSIGLSQEDVIFHTHSTFGLAWYAARQQRLLRADPRPLLTAAEAIGRVRPGVRLYAHIRYRMLG
jgi:Polysaccharide pyruvyl transferase